MRYALVEEQAWLNFRNMVHGHSHVAMLGWIYLGLYIFLIHSFLPAEKRNASFYKRLFWLTEFSVLGMLIAFPIQGYALWSISFSMLHVLLSYLFIYRFWKDMGKQSERVIYSRLFAKTAMLFMLLSTFALWAMGPIMAKGLRGTAIYHGAIQFYLHFQFNGWFIFGVLALFFKVLEDAEVKLPRRNTRFFILLVLSCLFTYALTITWTTPLSWLYHMNSFGVVLQFAALLSFLTVLKNLKRNLKLNFSGWEKKLLGFAFISFVLKICIQTALFFQSIASTTYAIRHFVIGFLHLLLLGLISTFLLGMGSRYKVLNFNNSSAKLGLILFLGGILLSELLLFGQGSLLWLGMDSIPYYQEALFFVSVGMPIGVLIILLTSFQERLKNA
jgi:hypothetical protein